MGVGGFKGVNPLWLGEWGIGDGGGVNRGKCVFGDVWVGDGGG